MNKNYVHTTLGSFLNESKSIMLKRKYGSNDSVIVGSNAPLRNQVLSYVFENVKVSKNELKRFIAGLNEGSRNPLAAANMWLNRNERFFIAESKNGITYYKLSPIGKRLSNTFISNNRLAEAESFRDKLELERPMPRFNRNELKRDIPIDNDIDDVPDEDFDLEETPEFDEDKEMEMTDDLEDEMNDLEGPEDIEDIEDDEMMPRFKGSKVPDFIEEIKNNNGDEDKYDFLDRRRGKPRPGLYDSSEECEECSEEEKIDESSKERIRQIIEHIRAKRNKKLYEEEEEKEEGSEEKPEKSEEDELTFDDLDLGTGNDEKEEGSEETIEKPEEDSGEETSDEKVEITEFVITVNDVEKAIEELEEKGVKAEQVIDEEGEPIEDQIKVSADDWDELKIWLENNGVNVEEMFGGEIEVEGGEEIEEPTEELEDLESEEGEESEESEEGGELESLEEPEEKSEE